MKEEEASLNKLWELITGFQNGETIMRTHSNMC